MKMRSRFPYRIFLIFAFMMVLISGIKLRSEAAVTINKKELVLLTGEKFRLKLKGVASAKVTWSSADPEIAKVSSKGNVTALTRGQTTIYAKTRNGKTFTCSLRVAEKPMIAAGLFTLGEEPEAMIGMSIGLIGSRRTKINKESVLFTPGKEEQHLFLLNVDKSIQKEKLVWKKSFYLSPSVLNKMNIATVFFAKKDETEIDINKKTKATIYFIYDGTRMKATVPIVSPDREEVKYCKVSRAE